MVTLECCLVGFCEYTNPGILNRTLLVSDAHKLPQKRQRSRTVLPPHSPAPAAWKSWPCREVRLKHSPSFPSMQQPGRRGGENNYFSFLAIKNDRSSMPLPFLPGPQNKSNLIVNILILKNTCRSDRLPTGKPTAISTESTAAEQWVHYFKLLFSSYRKRKNKSSVCVNKG